MALKDQNPAGLPFGLKVLWAIDWIQILKGQVWGLEQNGGGGSGGGTLEETLTLGNIASLPVIITDGTQIATHDITGFVADNGNENIAINADVIVSTVKSDGRTTSLIFDQATPLQYNNIIVPDDSGTVALQEWVNGQKGVPNGIASLDSSIKVPLEQLPFSTLIYKGTWIPNTNTPTLADGIGTTGDFYLVELDGTHDWGGAHGSVSYVAGNGVVYDGSIWQKVGSIVSGGVVSVSSANTGRLSVADGTGNAVLDVVSSPKLQTARNINNIAFDGTANILLNSTYNNQTGTTYTFALADNQKVVTATSASAQTYTVPTNASVAFPIGTRIDVIQLGAGKVTIAPVSGTVTINSYNGNKSIAGQYVGVTLLKTDTNTWLLIGNLIA